MEASATPVEARVTYTPSEVLHMVDAKANALFSGLGTLGFLLVHGVLGHVRESRYPTFYGVELRDLKGGGLLLLDIPKGLKPEVLSGREVEAGGFLQSRNGLRYSLQVSRLAPSAGVAAEVLKEDKALRDIFMRPSLGPAAFPDGEPVLVSCIHGKVSLVLADFENQLKDLAGVELETLPINLQAPDEVVEAIEDASGDVVVLARGGGAEGEFEVFNRPQVLDAWREKEAHKVSALGHTKNSTLLDRFSHKVCDTPTAAGAYIRASVDAQRDHRFLAQKAMQADQNLAEALKRSDVEWGKRLAAAVAAQPPAKIPMWVWPALLAAAGMGGVAGAVLAALAFKFLW